MGVGTKHRQSQTAESCKAHLRETHAAQRELVEEFIRDFEGTGKNSDLTRWSRFADLKDIKEEMIERLDAAFEEWLSPPPPR